MSGEGLSSGTSFLVEAARDYFASAYQDPQLRLSTAIDPTLNWAPAIHFNVTDHLTVIAEVSETPYPLIFSLRRAEVLRLTRPVAIYCVCPEESYLKNQAEAKRLMADGYGLITIAADASAQKRASCIPLIQQISGEEFSGEIRGLPKRVRARLAESFDIYNHNAPSGVANIAEVFEGFVLKAGREAASRSWISSADAKPGAPAKTLQAMNAALQFASAAAAIGAAQAYISMYRNLSHHFPRNARQAAKKYRDCRHGFLEGLKKIVFFRDAMRQAGLSGRL